MINKENYTFEYIDKLSKEKNVDKTILERNIYALGLVEALTKVGMPFIFKGGTSLTILLNKPKRLSTDIDIIVEPGTDINKYIIEASKIFPFKDYREQERKGNKNIVKKHFEFTYDSPAFNRVFYIILDVIFEENYYSKILEIPIKNDFIVTKAPYKNVNIPSIDCILGDKLTAFAPNTIGIPFNIDKELEIIKQMYDVSCLFDECNNFDDIYNTYCGGTTMAFRGWDDSEWPTNGEGYYNSCNNNEEAKKRQWTNLVDTECATVANNRQPNWP